MRPTRAEIQLPALRNNILNIRNAIGTSVLMMGVVKANAYGHGLVEIAQQMVQSGVEYLGVGFVEEGIALRSAGITSPILVLGGVLGNQVQKFLAFDFEITVSSLELAKHINSEVACTNGRKARVHLKIDTGMERLGIHAENAADFAEQVCMLPHIDVVGIFSHLATSDGEDEQFTALQLQRFFSAIEDIETRKIEIPLQHIANSGAVLEYQNSFCNLVRPGIMVYGVYPSLRVKKTIAVSPILSLKSKIVYLKEVPANTSISYSRTFFTKRISRIATLPIGYGDGYFRLLSNKAEVLINRKRVPVVGTICMDQLMVDVTDGGDIHVGDDVTLIGKDGKEEIPAEEIAGKIGTNVYEVLTNISTRVPRVYAN
jgi:alanine racemase